MRKVSATVIYKDNTLYNLTVNHKGVLIPLVAYDETSVKHPYEKRTFQTMYKSILNILKNSEWRYKHLIILCILIFPFVVLADLLKMNK